MVDFKGFSKKIKALRIEKGIYQSDIAKKLNVSTNTYMEYENNPGNMKISMLVAVGETLGVNLTQIFLQYVDTKCINSE